MKILYEDENILVFDDGNITVWKDKNVKDFIHKKFLIKEDERKQDRNREDILA